MKKLLLGLVVVSVFVLTGCTKTSEGEYKEGTYFGFDPESGYTASIYVSKDGNIESVLLDAAYTKDCKYENEKASCTPITKRSLGDDYGMAKTDDKLEWYEQADAFAKEVVKEQGLDFVTYKYRTTDEDGKYVFTTEAPEGQDESKKNYIDSVSGVTIHVNEMYTAVNNALLQAK